MSCECGLLMKSLLKQLGISTSELEIHQNGWSQSPGKETKRKVVQLNHILSSIFNFVLCIIYIATFLNSVVQYYIRRSNLNFWWAWSVLTRHWRQCDRQFLALLEMCWLLRKNLCMYGIKTSYYGKCLNNFYCHASKTHSFAALTHWIFLMHCNS